MENSRLDRAKVAFRFVPPHNRISGRMKIGFRAKKPSKLLSLPSGEGVQRRRRWNCEEWWGKRERERTGVEQQQKSQNSIAEKERRENSGGNKHVAAVSTNRSLSTRKRHQVYEIKILAMKSLPKYIQFMVHYNFL